MEQPTFSEMISPAQIQTRIEELAREINTLYQNQPVTVLCILKGAFIFAADLVRCLKMPIEMKFAKLSSYVGDKSSGRVDLVWPDTLQMPGMNVLVVEDIIDSGLTVDFLLKHIRSSGPTSLRVCCLLDKPTARKVPIEPDFCGFKIPNEFVVGYGLDYNERFRQLPHIARQA